MSSHNSLLSMINLNNIWNELDLHSQNAIYEIFKIINYIM